VTRRADELEGGFTLPELIVAITILGIIMVAIGAMITTAFRTTATVSDQLNASRGPKVVSRYWVPDVESAVDVGGGAAPCGSGDTTVARFAWTQEPSTIATKDADPAAGPFPAITVTWWRRDGARTQLVRQVCVDGVLTDTTTVVADLDTAAIESDGRVQTLRVTVPDESRTEKTFDFSVAARQQVTP
jgi:prepilin-type N-terminal cleavage/methylation domain-containing protein